MGAMTAGGVLLALFFSSDGLGPDFNLLTQPPIHPMSHPRLSTKQARHARCLESSTEVPATTGWAAGRGAPKPTQ